MAYPVRTRNFLAFSFLSALLLSACGDADTPLQPLVPPDAPVYSQSDTVYHWVDNTIEFSHNGSEWRIERDDDETVTEAWVYENDVLVATIDVVYDGSSPESIELRHPDLGGSASIDDSGVTDTSWGTGGGGGGECGHGGPCVDFVASGCSAEWNAFEEAVGTAFTAGAVAIATFWMPGVHKLTAAIFAGAVANAALKLYDYVGCLL